MLAPAPAAWSVLPGLPPLRGRPRRAAAWPAALATAAVVGRSAMRAKPSWQQSMLRIKDPRSSLEFYERKMGMRRFTREPFLESTPHIFINNHYI